MAVEKQMPDFSAMLSHGGLMDRAYPMSKMSDYLKGATGWVYACVGAIADEIASIDLKLYEIRKNETKEIVEHDALDLIYRANNFTTKFDLFYNMQQLLELCGEAPWLLVKNGKRITDILLLRPDCLIVKPGKDVFVEKYLYRVGLGSEIQIEPQDLIMFKYADPTNPYRGRGTLSAVAKTVDIDNFSEDYNRNFFYNSAVPSSVLKTEQKLNDETIKRLRYSMDKMYKGVDKAHKTAILEQGLDWQPMTMSHKDMEFLEQSRFSRDKILGIFRVPRTVLGITDDVNRANAEATDYVFSKRTIKPKMQRLVEQLNEFYLPLFAGTENMYFDFTDPVPENTEAKLREYETGLKNGYLTINEVRAREGLEGVGVAGDGVYLPFSVSNVLATETIQPIEDVSKQLKSLHARNRKNIRLDLQNKISEKLFPIAKEMLKDVNNKKEVLLIEKDEKLRKFWEMKDATAKKIETVLENKVTGFFEEQVDAILSVIPKKAGTLDDIIKKINAIIEKDKTKFAKLVFEPLLQSVVASAKDTNEFIGTSIDIDVDNPKARKFIKEHALELSRDITQTTRDAVGKTLADGIQVGESMKELADRVNGLYDGFGTVRALAIARTETILASNWATSEVYKESGVVQNKIWLTAFDERTCPVCGGLDGETKALNAEFRTDNGMVDAPPAHPNCRCTIIPEIK